YSKWPMRNAPVSRSTSTTSSWVGMRCIMSSPSSMSAAAGEHPRNGSQQDLPVERERPVVDVLHVHLHPGIEVELVAAGYGPESGQTRAHTQPPPLPSLVVFDLAGDRGPRAHQRHIAAQHVPQLRPFVDRELPQPSAKPGPPWIAGNLERGLLGA